MIRNCRILIFITFIGILSIQGFGQCPVVVISGTNVNCYGGSTGTVSTSVSGGSGSYQWQWNNGEVTPSLSGLGAGIYFVNVTDLVTGCTTNNLYNVTQPDILLGFTTPTPVSCYGQSTGSIDLLVTGGTAPFNFQWSNGATTEDISGLQAGTFNVNITDAGGCTATAAALVSQTPSSVNSTITAQDVSCQQGSDGSVSLTPFGGQAPYTFNWNNGMFLSEDVSGLTAGAYHVVITDALGCIASNTINIGEPTAIQSNISGTDALCFGSATGTVNLSPSGGTPPYSFAWTNSQFTLGTNEDLSNVAAETYNVQITDANGCTSFNSFTVSEPAELTTSLTLQHISCYGFSDGSISQIVSGGTGPYNFSWSDVTGPLSTTAQNISNLTAGSYQVIISDAHSCTTSSQILLTQPLTPLSSSVSVTHVNCYGENTGNADLSISGGTPPYVVSWSNGFLQEDQPNLFAGNYTALIVDANGCTEQSSAIVTQPSNPLSSSSVSTPVTCYGQSNGAINFSVSGGTTPYSYTWINSQFALSVITQDISNSPAETYVITITDANSCTLTDTSIITEPPLLESSIQPVHILCHGDSTGAIDLTIAGGVAPYTIQWSNYVVTEDQMNLFAGSYDVIIYDQNGCTVTDTITLIQPAAPLSSVHFEKTTTCFGFQDGYILYSLQGGTPPYQHLWSTGDTVSQIFNLQGGLYVIANTDAHACLLTDSIIVPEPALLNISSQVTDIICAGDSSGNINLSISGGTIPYSYTWMNDQFVLSAISEDLIQYPAGNYAVVVTDSAGCMAGEQIIIQEPEAIKISMVASNISCGGGNDGIIDIDVTGGTSPYTYAWNTGATTQDASQLSAGNYSATVTDAHNCTTSASYTLYELPALDLKINISPTSCSLLKDGAIAVAVFNGSGNYTYSWDSIGTENPYLNLGPGEYHLRVTDSGKCSKDSVLNIPENPHVCLEIPSAFTPNGDEKNDRWNIRNIELYPNCTIDIFNRWGNRLYSSTGYTEPWDGRFQNQKLPAGTYYYIINPGDETEATTGTVTIIY